MSSSIAWYTTWGNGNNNNSSNLRIFQALSEMKSRIFYWQFVRYHISTPEINFMSDKKKQLMSAFFSLTQLPFSLLLMVFRDFSAFDVDFIFFHFFFIFLMR
jgi:hypothetical protein